MAQFRFSAAIVSRSAGQSVVAAAAYRAGEKLRDERTGDIKDYSRRGGVLNTLILTPENVSQWMLDRERLWNQVERREDHSTKPATAQLARSLELSLPHELTHEQHVELLRDYIKTEYVALGMIADIAIHAPPKRGDGTNHHAHVLLTMRDIEGDGFGTKNRTWNQKARIQYWRERWAYYQNRALEKYGFEARVDHRSLEDQGIDREATTHLGPGAQAMEDQGIQTDRGNENRRRKASNDNREQLKAYLADINRQIAALERLQTIVGAVEEGYRRVEQDAAPEPPSTDLEIRGPQSYVHGPEASPMPDAQSEAHKIAAEAIRKEKERQEQARKTEEERPEQARKDQDKLQEAIIAEDKRLKQLGQMYRDAQAHRDQLVQQAQELALAHDRFEQAQERQAQRQNPVEAYAREVDQAVEGRRQDLIHKRDNRYLEGDIRNAGDRYAQALHHNYDWGDPYQSLAKAAIAEHASFRTDQALLSAEIAKTGDPKAREALEIRRQIEGYEYLMITGERIAVQSELITGRTNSEEAVKMRNAVRGEILKDENGKQVGFIPGYTQQVENLRFRYRELQAERAAPAKEQTQPQSALDKIVEDARKTPEPAGADKQQERPATALDTIVEDAKRQTPAPSRSRRPRRIQEP